MGTNPTRDEAVSVRRYDWSKDGMRITASGGFVFSPDHNAAIAALRSEVSRLREFVDAVKVCRDAESEVRIHEVMNPRSRNYRLPIYEAQRIARERVTELLTNLDPTP